MNSSNSANNNGLSEAVAISLGLGVEVIELAQLSTDEERERLHLERKVERAFYEAGMALKELRDRRLYRSTHKTFEEYCRERFGYGRDAAYLKIVEKRSLRQPQRDYADKLSANSPADKRTSGTLQ